jgi:dTMP kinase
MQKAKSKFIVIEGGEGSGKSSLISYAKEYFGNQVIVTREPGGSEYAETIREVALKNALAKQACSETMMCLMFAARYDHIKNKIKPALEEGKIIISDRFDGSSYAYNVWAQSEGGVDKLFWNLREVMDIKPDVYVFVDVEISEGLKRARTRNKSTEEGNHFDDREVKFHEKVKEGYVKFLSHVHHVTVDANRPLEEVKKSFVETLEKIFNS